MKLSLSTDEFDRLICVVEDGGRPVTVTAASPEAAIQLAAATYDAMEEGLGECFWSEGGGEYRWMFRRNGEKLRVVILWSTGTMTGWENVLWTECLAQEFRDQVDREVARVQTAA